MTDLLYAKTTSADDGCDWIPVIIWRMNAGARARSCSCFVPTPRPIQVNPVHRVAKPKKVPVQAVNTSGRWLKTHTATVITAKGEKTVKIRETATVWSAGSKENYDKLTGQRVGAPGRCCLLLDELESAEKRVAELERKEKHIERQSVIDGMANSGEAWSDIEEYMQKWDEEHQAQIAAGTAKGE
ncbi:TPA: hypothetical protein ACOED1_003495 [Enterobacter kobei]